MSVLLLSVSGLWLSRGVLNAAAPCAGELPRTYYSPHPSDREVFLDELREGLLYTPLCD